MRPDSELLSLIYLMEDPDPVIRDAVRERLVERGEDAVEQIERFVLPQMEEERKEKYFLLLDEIRADIAIDQLSLLLKDPQPKLDKALYLITRVADTSAVEIIYFSTLENLMDEISLEISEDKTPVENIGIFNFLFFKRFGFRHTDTKMQRPEAALLDRVLLSRGGNPVTVTLAFFLLAGLTGLPVYPLCFPGGFVPVYLDQQGNILFYLNIFKQGTIFAEDTLRQFFEEIGMTYNPENLRIEEERALLSIYAELLSFVYKNNGDEVVGRRIDRVIELLGGRRYL
ncbi:MAG: hypothetical protein EOM61_01625 [Bacteroidia bacterium]|nr:transglutaminase family protein [Rikenellaceae bacterium]NCB18303.1 hypothetical protein [Bacteroidia bacterium]